MQTTLKQFREVAVLSLSGQLDDRSAELFLAQIEELVGQGLVRVVVNLVGVDFVSASGVRGLLTALRKVRHHGGDLKLVDVPRQASRLLTIIGALTVLELYPDVFAAVASFQPEYGPESLLCPASA
ncbi:MAG TPA: STAS domain-containing protein [Anaerolineae bacterium]|nr:STAS domain-containing protein [Anaerolineae bacterium]HMR65541.1 STAS domain-containing protein [Anaerolineae bacterium]